MYDIKKGSIISESNGLVTLVSKITSDVEVTQVEGRDYKQQEFQSKVIRTVVQGFINDIEDGSTVDYLVGGVYGPEITVIAY